jgi:hypothetical protein
MTLDDIFNAGHLVAFTHGPMRYVVRCPNPPKDDGYWPVAEDVIDAVAYRKRAEPGDLAGLLSDTDKEATHWKVDDDHCWCDECAGTRKMLETQGD